MPIRNCLRSSKKSNENKSEMSLSSNSNESTNNYSETDRLIVEDSNSIQTNEHKLIELDQNGNLVINNNNNMKSKDTNANGNHSTKTFNKQNSLNQKLKTTESLGKLAVS